MNPNFIRKSLDYHMIREISPNSMIFESLSLELEPDPSLRKFLDSDEIGSIARRPCDRNSNSIRYIGKYTLITGIDKTGWRLAL